VRVIFAIDGLGQSSEIGEMLLLAIATCRRYTSLSPAVLSTGFRADFKIALQRFDVELVEVDTPMAPAILEANRTAGYPLQAIGNYLRYEACNLFPSEDVILYCDCDVIFIRDPILPPSTAILSAGPEDKPNDYEHFNSGVLLMNIPAFSSEISQFYQFSQERLLNFFPGFDQPSLNAYFGSRIERLPLELNWRPYWGPNAAASIVHFHGVKYGGVTDLLAGVYKGAAARLDLVLDLTDRTMSCMEFFLSRLDPTSFSDIPYYKKLMALTKHSNDIYSRPAFSYFKALVNTRFEASKEANNIREEIFNFAIKENVNMFRSVEVDVGDATEVRLVFPAAPSLFGIGDIESTQGEIVGRAISVTHNGVQTMTPKNVGDREVIFLKPSATTSNIDVIFRLPNVERGKTQKLRIWLFAPVDVKFKLYLARDAGFSEAWAWSVDTAS
jgi:hypothetical protein